MLLVLIPCTVSLKRPKKRKQGDAHTASKFKTQACSAEGADERSLKAAKITQRPC